MVAEHAAWLEAGIASDGSRRMTGARHNIKPYPLVAVAERTINVTDPDARNLKTPRGCVQGYNAQAVVTGEQIVIAAEISTESLDTANLRPMVTAAEEELHAAGVADGLDVVLADAGYWTNSAIEALAAEGLQPLVARTPIVARNAGRGAAAGFMTSCAGSWPASAAASSTAAKPPSSPCSGRSRPTAAPTASCAAAAQPSDPNGGCWRPPTTCSSSTATDSRPPEATPGRAPPPAPPRTRTPADRGGTPLTARKRRRGFLRQPPQVTDELTSL